MNLPLCHKSHQNTFQIDSMHKVFSVRRLINFLMFKKCIYVTF